MKPILILFVLVSLNVLNLQAEKFTVKDAKIVKSVESKGDLETASTFGIGHGFGYRRRHFGYGHGWSPWFGYNGGYYQPRPSFGKIIITYPTKYIGHGHGHGHGYGRGFGHGFGHTGLGHGYGKGLGFGHGHGHYGGFKKGGFYPSRYLGPIYHSGDYGGSHYYGGKGYGWR